MQRTQQAILFLAITAMMQSAFAQDVLPFPEPTSASVAGKTLKDSKRQGRIERSVPSVHTASETFDVGKDLGSPVALDYYGRAPFKFNGKIEKIHISYIE